MPLLVFELDWTMQTTYVVCATAGGTVLALQTLLLLFGIGDGHADVGLHHDVSTGHTHEGSDHSSAAFNLLSVRAVASFLTFFGLAGCYGTAREWAPMSTLGLAVLSGAVLMLIVAWMVHAQSRLQSKGNIDSKNALGLSARVYLRIPGANAGFGKVTVKVQSRSVEFNAFTLGAELPTGALVKLTRQSTPDTFEVVALEER